MGGSRDVWKVENSNPDLACNAAVEPRLELVLERRGGRQGAAAGARHADDLLRNVPDLAGNDLAAAGFGVDRGGSHGCSCRDWGVDA